MHPPERSEIMYLVWSDGKLAVVFDLHCPWIAGNENEQICMIGDSSASITMEQERFSTILQRTSESDHSLPYKTSNYIPFGTTWNTGSNYTKGKCFSSWAQELKEVKLIGLIRIPLCHCIRPRNYTDKYPGFSDIRLQRLCMNICYC